MPDAVRHFSARLAFMVMLAGLGGCAGAPNMLDARGYGAEGINLLWWVMFWAGTAVFGLVMVVMLVALLRRRDQADPQLDAQAERRISDRLIGGGGVLLPLVVLVPLLGFTAYTSTAMIPPRPPALTIEVIGHHMYTTGLPQLGMNFFAAASMMIAIPSGVIIFGTLATIWLGRPVWKTPLLYVLGFVITFVLGGITGVMVAAVPFDYQVHDSYFVVAHFHYVLIGGTVFPLLAGLHYWWPKATGRMPSEQLGRWSFWLSFIGFHITFFTMHITGMLGMPRRVYTYPAGLNWDWLNMISTLGSFVMALGLGLFLFNLAQCLRNGERVEENPWGAGTLEWATSSPPAQYNFARIPGVSSREPLWDDGTAVGLYNLGDKQREALGSSLLDADPEQRLVLPGPSIWPFFLAIAVGLLFICPPQWLVGPARARA
ncbi:MAG: cbb3-type cytochrome c oxidase subunit I [Oscillochloridaceae bacterium umkhey_bin13]